MMAFPSIDAVRNLRSNRVRTARLTPPQGYGDAWRRLVQRNAAQRVQQCVSQRDRWCAVAGHSRRRPAWCTLHCHSSGDSSGGESGARLQCCALLPQPSAPHSSQIFAGGGVSPRRRGSASARSCCLDHVPARQQVALAVDAADLQGERALRPEHVRRRDRTAKMRRAPSTAQSLRQSERGAAAGHGTRACNGTELRCLSDRPSVATSLVRRVSGRRCCFLLRDRLMFVLRDGASPCAAAATPAPQRALLPCAPQKQQARPPWALWQGSFACVC